VSVCGCQWVCLGPLGDRGISVAVRECRWVSVSCLLISVGSLSMSVGVCVSVGVCAWLSVVYVGICGNLWVYVCCVWVSVVFVGVCGRMRVYVDVS